MTPLVSVIVTVYQRTCYLREALESALGQTLSEFEIIVTDDSDSDAIRQLCEEIGRPDVIRYRTNPKNLGVALNLRAAIEEARGKYVAILNDDDQWEPRFLERLAAPLEEDPERVIAFSDHWIIDQDGAILAAESEKNSILYGRHVLAEGDLSDPTEFVLCGNGVPLAMAALFRRDALDLKQLLPQVVGAYDFWISCLLAATGRPFFYVAERLTRYRLHPAMETGRASIDKSLNMTFIFQRMLERDYFPQARSYLRRRLAGWLFQCAKESLHFDCTAKARGYLIRSLRVFPSWRSLAGLLISVSPRAMRQASGFTLKEPQKAA